ncbi:MAG: hypothetical protein COX40_00495 [Candidatus Omnitrophica bacterium CG23_combo_of_CG06-09_8_20_14_all_40_11]|nr:MAG: hypothetical protein COX40_00495 [Candidatus Omnitrophica bacterium CG23_combo_of_CG06-09_8_20_14_all_40_11]
MENFRLSRAPISMKLFLTSLLCIVGLIYISLLVHIWQDTEMKPSLIAKGYGSMEAMELTEHTHKYLPYYALYLFAIPIILFMFTSYSEKIKRIIAVFPFLLIVIDIGSMWLIPYVSQGFFSWVLLFAGTFLGLIFLLLFLLNVYDIWLKKSAA